MKKSHLLIAATMVSVFFSCSKEKNEDITVDSDYVMVKLGAKLEFSEEPLTKATSNDDLYALRVYQYMEDNDGSLLRPECAAYGTFDDISKAVIKMSKRYKYGIDLAYIPNAKNLVHQYSDGTYGLPFDPKWCQNAQVNELIYRNLGDEPAFSIEGGYTQEKGIESNNVRDDNYWSTVTRYQGYTVIDPSVSSSATVDLHYQMIGFKIEISDFTAGQVGIQSTFPHTYNTTPSSNNTGLIDVIVTAEHMPTCNVSAVPSEGNEKPTIDDIKKCIEDTYESMIKQGTVQIVYTDENGNKIPLYIRSCNFSYRPNIRYVLKFSLSDAITNGGISANVVEKSAMEDKEFQF